MLRDLDAIDISRDYEFPIGPTAVEEDIMSMLVGSSSIPKWKRQA